MKTYLRKSIGMLAVLLIIGGCAIKPPTEVPNTWSWNIWTLTSDTKIPSCPELIKQQLSSYPRIATLIENYDTLLSGTEIVTDENDLIGYYFSFYGDLPDLYILSLVENYRDRILPVEYFQVDKKTGNICIYNVVTDSCDEQVPTDKNYSQLFQKTCKLTNQEKKPESKNEVHFEASGNEPFWSFSLKGDTLELSTPEDGTRKHHVVVDKHWDNYDITGEVIRAKIWKESCIDDRIGETHSYSVHISYQPERTEKGCADLIQ